MNPVIAAAPVPKVWLFCTRLAMAVSAGSGAGIAVEFRRARERDGVRRGLHSGIQREEPAAIDDQGGESHEHSQAIET